MKDACTAAGRTSKHAVSLASLLRIIFWGHVSFRGCQDALIPLIAS